MVRTKVQTACGMCRSKAHLLDTHDEINASSEAASSLECPSVDVASVIVIIVGTGEVKRSHASIRKFADVYLRNILTIMICQNARM